METTNKITIGEIVAQDFRTASVFSKYGIDFCCKGHRTLEEVCEKKNIDENMLATQLDTVMKSSGGQSIDYKVWPLDLLTDYIEKTHHRYIEEKTPSLLVIVPRPFLSTKTLAKGIALKLSAVIITPYN